MEIFKCQCGGIINYTCHHCNHLIVPHDGWQLITEEIKPPHGIPCEFYSKEWIDRDFNEIGVREGHFTDNGDPEDYTSCLWNGCQDCWTEDYSKPTHFRIRTSPSGKYPS